MHQKLCVFLTTPTQSTLLGSACKSFVRLGLHSPQRVDSLAPMGNKRTVSFSRTQRRTVSSEIEPGVCNLSITNPTSNIGGNVRLMFDVIYYANCKNIPGAMLSVDLHEAF